MNLSALVAAAAIAVCIVGAAPAEAQSPPPVGALAACGDGSAFLGKVYILKTPFRPDLYSPAYAAPGDNGLVDPNSNIAKDMQAAFDIAPPFFRDRLCGLTKIFINPTGCGNVYNCVISERQALDNSWGYRERQDQVAAPPYKEYIATSAGLWKGGSPAPVLSVFETAMLQALLGWNGASYRSASPDTSAMAVLAALAHEYGHVLWYDVYNPNHILDFFEEPADFCNFRTFFRGQWRRVAQQDLQPPKWRGFRASQNDRPNDDAVIGNPQAPQSGTLLDDAKQHRVAGTSQKLRKIFKNPGRWPSLFAAFAPDEDFVETFKFYVLLQLDRAGRPTRLTSLTLEMPNGTTADVPSDYATGGPGSRPVLRRKLGCFFQRFPPP
jgi:hypothetical protein